MERATFQDYEAKVGLHILDERLGIGGVRLSKLTRKIVVEYRDSLLLNGRSEATTRKVLSTLSLVVKFAQEKGLTASNPVRDVWVMRTSRVDDKVAAPSKELIRQLIETASDDFKPLLAVAAVCGLRASESRALRWSDVDFDEGLIRVRRRADAFNKIGEPKSKAGLRAVSMGRMVRTS
ncbi:MAG: tyrosine-type recombinase/integrase [Pirellulales bacterium]|nr:tyrosine-type recombinase/integrase [Pirellulales bacterium]